MRTLLFTDLDGTLIDHHSYSPEHAKLPLQRLLAAGIPVIFCSSKTFAEQVPLQRALKIHLPFILENGSAVAIPNGYFPSEILKLRTDSSGYGLKILAEKNIKDIQLALEHLQSAHHFVGTGYLNSTYQDIARHTGLKGNAVWRAKKRNFTESLFTASPNPSAMKKLEELGFTTMAGGRFLTIQDKAIDKGKAVKWLCQLFQTYWGETPRTIGVGDSANDAAFLAVVDFPFLVQKPDQTWAAVEVKGLNKVDAVGPLGFAKIADLWLNGDFLR